MKTIPLPDPKYELLNIPLQSALKKRRSIREYSANKLELYMLSTLLWGCCGKTREEGGKFFRTAPSAGALYAVETYVSANNVKNLSTGLYLYAPEKHELVTKIEKNLSHELEIACFGQKMCSKAQALLIWIADFQKITTTYGERGIRYLHLDAAHMAQNLALCATAMELGTCQIGAFDDSAVNSILGLDGVRKGAIYMSVVGKPAF